MKHTTTQTNEDPNALIAAIKSSDEPELVPETYTKKLTDKDMAEAKTKVKTERKMTNIKQLSSEGPELFPETYTKIPLKTTWQKKTQKPKLKKR